MSASALGRAIALAAAIAASVASAAAETPSRSAAPPSVSNAIAAAAQSRVAKGAAVSVWQITNVRLPEEAETEPILAIPDPAARVGAPARFVLSVQRPGESPRRVGDATAVIQVVGPAVRLTRAVTRGERLTAADVAAVESDMSGRPFRPMPTLEQSVGARVTRDIAMNSVLASADIAAEPLVRAGDTVSVRARVGAVEITAQLVAIENGLRDQTIRVVNKETRRTLRARVTGKGEVEVMDVPE